jgi:hypothetical protein
MKTMILLAGALALTSAPALAQTSGSAPHTSPAKSKKAAPTRDPATGQMPNKTEPSPSETGDALNTPGMTPNTGGTMPEVQGNSPGASNTGSMTEPEGAAGTTATTTN